MILAPKSFSKSHSVSPWAAIAGVALVLSLPTSGWAKPVSQVSPSVERIMPSNDEFFMEAREAYLPESLGAASEALGDEGPFEIDKNEENVEPASSPLPPPKNIPIPTPRPDRNRLDSMLQYVPEELHDRLRNSGIPAVPLARAIDFRQRMLDLGKTINRDQLVVADLTLENNRDRMWLIDLVKGTIVAQRTAHGAGGSESKGGNAWMCAHRFGNKSHRLTSPGGGFVFGCAFDGSPIPRLRRNIGAKRRSIWMIGMDRANENSARRAVIFHEGYSINSGALYTDNRGGGRSSGCLTIKPEAYQTFEDIVAQPAQSCPRNFPTEPAGGAPLYVYPERADVLSSNPVYWDVQCSEDLKKRRKSRQYLE